MDNWSVTHPKLPRIGFYPACGRDVQESAAIFAPFVDRILFCDIDRRKIPYWDRLKRTLPPNPRGRIQMLRRARCARGRTANHRRVSPKGQPGRRRERAEHLQGPLGGGDPGPVPCRGWALHNGRLEPLAQPVQTSNPCQRSGDACGGRDRGVWRTQLQATIPCQRSADSSLAATRHSGPAPPRAARPLDHHRNEGRLAQLAAGVGSHRSAVLAVSVAETVTYGMRELNAPPAHRPPAKPTLWSFARALWSSGQSWLIWPIRTLSVVVSLGNYQEYLNPSTTI